MSLVFNEGTTLVDDRAELHVSKDGEEQSPFETGGSELFHEQCVRIDEPLMFIGGSAEINNRFNIFMAGQLLNFGWGHQLYVLGN